MLRERLGEHCAGREIKRTLCGERDLGNTVLCERLRNVVLRGRMGEYCADRESGGTLCCGRDWGNTVLREKLWEHCTERKIG